MLPRRTWPAWLGDADDTAKAVAGLLNGHLTRPVRIWPVSPRVGRVGENDAELAVPIAVDQ